MRIRQRHKASDTGVNGADLIAICFPRENIHVDKRSIDKTLMALEWVPTLVLLASE